MTHREVKKKIKRLQQIEQDRLKFVGRWKKVLVETDGERLIITWSKPKPVTLWQSHRKERPIKTIDSVIQYHLKKLKEQR